MKVFIILFILIFSKPIIIFAQEDDLAMVVKFKVAMDAYEKMDYKGALRYLGQIPDDNAKAKVSYWSAKCYQKIIALSPHYGILDSIYSGFLNNINIYLKYGKDENKKEELLKLKIQLEDSEEYKEAKKMSSVFEKMTSEKAFSTIKQIMKDYPQDTEFPIVYSMEIKNDHFLELIRGTGVGCFNYICIDLRRAYSDKVGEFKPDNPTMFEYLIIHAKDIKKLKKCLVELETKYITSNGFIPLNLRQGTLNSFENQKIEFSSVNYVALNTSWFYGINSNNYAISDSFNRSLQVIINHCNAN